MFLRFPMCAPTCSQYFSLYPFSSALSFTLVIYISSPKKDITTYLLGDSPKLDLLPFVKERKKKKKKALEVPTTK
jgi:hypothetical protein